MTRSPAIHRQTHPGGRNCGPVAAASTHLKERTVTRTDSAEAEAAARSHTGRSAEARKDAIAPVGVLVADVAPDFLDGAGLAGESTAGGVAGVERPGSEGADEGQA